MLGRRHSQRGFSMIELMIAISIAAILVAFGVPSYKSWVQNTKIRTTSESILNGLQIARSEAVRRNASVQFVLGANGAWTVGCVTVVPPPVAPATTPLGCPATIQSRTIGEGGSSTISMTPTPAASTTVAFSNLGTVLAVPAPFTQVDFTMNSANLTSDTRPLRVTIGLGGNTKMCDPSSSLSSTDPRRC